VQPHRVLDFFVPISNFPSGKSVSSDPWEDFSHIFRRERQPLPQAWADVFGPLRKGTVDDFVIVGQIGQSLDGRVATESGHSKYINGPAGLVHLHRLRALVDAVVVGVGTAIADDPQLTVRRVSGPQPARVVIDPKGRLGADARMFADNGVRR
jgi:diaminohydroxyphosphoribosylaminopyrimidine deaminase/5-amino-6-(5-phosphoribosylamino)uracil reductase